MIHGAGTGLDFCCKSWLWIPDRISSKCRPVASLATSWPRNTVKHKQLFFIPKEGLEKYMQLSLCLAKTIYCVVFVRNIDRKLASNWERVHAW